MISTPHFLQNHLVGESDSHSHPDLGSHSRFQALQWICSILYFSCTSVKTPFFPTSKISLTVKRKNPPCSEREQQELDQCCMLCGKAAPDSALVELFYINERFLYSNLYYRDLSILERWKHLIRYCLSLIFCFPLLPCNLSLCDPLMLHVQHLPHLLITGSIVPDNSAPARLQGGSASPHRVSLLPPKPEELITFSSW